MDDFNTDYKADVELMRLAKKRVGMRRGLMWHAASFALVNIFLVGVWFITPGSYFWPIWPILGWGLGLAFHAAGVFFSLKGGKRSDAVEQEFLRLKQAAPKEDGSDGPRHN